jgi:phosphatidylinositol 4-phosphatase
MHAEAGADRFVVPCILGFVRQIENAPVVAGVKRDAVTVTLIARRATHRAGTRHWRRGADAAGDVANFVETEQIAETSSGEAAAFVQLRGSIPLAWSQVLFTTPYDRALAASAPSLLFVSGICTT